MKDIEEQIRENSSLVHHVLNRYYSKHTHDDDMYQAGLIGLWKAIKTYDPSKGAFSTYACRIIYNECGMELKHLLKSPVLRCVSTNELVVQDSGNDTTVEDMLAAPDTDVDFSAEFSSIISSLSPYNQDILKLRSEGYTYRHIAKLKGVSYTKVHDDIKSLRKIFEDHGLIKAI